LRACFFFFWRRLARVKSDQSRTGNCPCTPHSMRRTFFFFFFFVFFFPDLCLCLLQWSSTYYPSTPLRIERGSPHSVVEKKGFRSISHSPSFSLITLATLLPDSPHLFRRWMFLHRVQGPLPLAPNVSFSLSLMLAGVVRAQAGRISFIKRTVLIHIRKATSFLARRNPTLDAALTFLRHPYCPLLLSGRLGAFVSLSV